VLRIHVIHPFTNKVRAVLKNGTWHTPRLATSEGEANQVQPI
jgi:hypothetical protein